MRLRSRALAGPSSRAAGQAPPSGPEAALPCPAPPNPDWSRAEVGAGAGAGAGASGRRAGMPGNRSAAKPGDRELIEGEKERQGEREDQHRYWNQPSW